jgi:SAM-dependent methyltransferase
MYRIIPTHIPHDRRREINGKILFSIDAGRDEVPAETIYNTYTGLGGLHGLHQSDYDNYHDYAQAKKEHEMGQFFTPHEICRQMTELLAPTFDETVLEMCCGMGNFANWFPNRHNFHGFDIDPDAIKVARYLYPDANFQVGDITTYDPGHLFDIVIGNPPFNLDFKGELSQLYYLRRAHDVLNPGGLLMCIVPSSFLSSEFWEKSRIRFIDRDFSFIGQTELSPDAFAGSGVEYFQTKVMVFMRAAHCIESRPYDAEESVSW